MPVGTTVIGERTLASPELSAVRDVLIAAYPWTKTLHILSMVAWMAGLYDHRPLFVAHGEGCRFTDVDGNSYVDFNQADLSASCGFVPACVTG